MAFDKPTRNRLASFVGKARDLIAEEFTQQFQSLYGISDKGTITPLDQLAHLDDTGLATASLLRERIDYLVKTHPDDREGIKAAVTRLAREQAFTVLNRLAAIRMAEKRGIIVESVGKGYQSKGFKVFEQVAGSGLGDTYHRYCRYLFCLFDELAVDLGVLFDRSSPQGLLFPRETPLQGILSLLDSHDLDSLWAEDETIGWVYQYYNDPEERKKMRDPKQGGSAAPRNSRELAVRNQFFTPRYVVEFLTDNTLGRIWYEMTKSETRLAEQCRYLVHRPTEIFLKPGEIAPVVPEQEGLSQEELINQPVHIPHRPLKDPRELRMLDPACGSMHFGLYSFDLYEIMYEEAWDMGIESLRRDFPDKDVFLRELPRLIIEHNIHGIDIDPRAVQIAGLSLWLRAQRSWQAERVPAGQRPRILRSNIVCAEPMPGEKELLREFTACLEVPALGYLVEQVFDKMKLAGEAGSLLMIEEEIRDIIAEAKRLWKTGPKLKQTDLFGESPAEPEQAELSLDFTGITNERFWEDAEEKLYQALQEYAEVAGEHGYQRRLFAEDAARGFAFIDVCRKHYDVALMNPPFGEPPAGCKAFLTRKYSEQAEDLYCWFVQRGREFTEGGLLGVISSDSFIRYTDYDKYRQYIINDSLLVMLIDLGWDVLDGAYVSAATYIINSYQKSATTSFIDLTSIDDKNNIIDKCVDSLNGGESNNNIHIHPLSIFKIIDGKPFCFWFSDKFFQWVKTASKIREYLGDHGIGAGPHNFFFRLNWEIPYKSRSDRTIWPTLVNGGGFSPFSRDHHLCIDWRGNGKLIKAHLNEIYPYLNGNVGIKIQRESVYYRPGLTYGKRSDRFNAQILPSGAIPSFEGIGLYPKSLEDAWWILSFLNSRFTAYFLNLTCGLHKNSIYIDRIPVPNFTEDDKVILSKASKLLHRQLQLMNSTGELSNFFVLPPVLSSDGISIRAKIVSWRCHDRLSEIRLWSIYNDIENLVNSRLPEFEELDKAIITDQGINPYSISASISDFDSIEVPERCNLTCRPLVNRDNGFESTDMFRLSVAHGISLASAQKYLDDSSFVSCNELTYETNSLISWMLGVTVGRWDIRFATKEKQNPELPDPFAPLPVCPPGMLKNGEGLPAEAKDLPANYPYRITWPGILVDDENHPEDIVVRVDDALKVIWTDRWEAIEHEACELLGVKTLRDYFRRPSGFFADHLKRYSKSRRQAPIYWPLSTAKGSYTIWIYYHRLTDQTLHTALADFVDPKLKSVRVEISALRESATHRDRLEELLDLEKELADFHTEIERIIKLPWKPNLNDGVLITASPLWKLFRLPKWQKDLKACWEKLEKGDYDWAHLAYSIWPKRVEDVCKKDRSIAIAHGLEHLCQVEPPKPKGTRGRKKAVQAELDELSE